MADLQYVCDDAGNTTWNYDPAAKMYVRINTGDQSVAGMISGEYLPNPEALWANRRTSAAVTADTSAGQRLKPTAATYALWEHWQGVLNANNNS